MTSNSNNRTSTTVPTLPRARGRPPMYNSMNPCSCIDGMDPGDPLDVIAFTDPMDLCTCIDCVDPLDPCKHIGPVDVMDLVDPCNIIDR